MTTEKYFKQSNVLGANLEFMDFRTIIDRLARSKDIETRDLLSGVGLTMAAYYKWKNGTQPAEWNIKRIEDAYGVRFIRDEPGVYIVNFRSTEEVISPRTETAMPATARDLYEHVAMSGGRPVWTELTAEQRAAVENIFFALKDDVSAQVSRANNEIRKVLLGKS
jgi:hypothetical protein